MWTIQITHLADNEQRGLAWASGRDSQHRRSNRWSLLLAMVVLAAAAIPGSAGQQSLLLSRCVAEQGLCSTVELVRYRFAGATVQSTEVITRLAASQALFGRGSSHLVSNRYLVSAQGDVVDLKSGALLHDGTGTLLQATADGVLIEVGQGDSKELLTYDLHEHRCRRTSIGDGWGLPGVRAPDRQHAVTASWWGDGELHLHSRDGSQRTLASGLEAELDERSTDLAVVPLLWLDADRLLSQRHNGALLIITLDGTVTALPTVDIEQRPMLAPRLERRPDGQVLYRCGAAVYLVDPEGGAPVLLDWLPVGHGFELELHPPAGRGLRLRHRGAEIGRYWCLHSSAVTSEGWIAIAFAPTGASLANPGGVAVWSEASGRWTEIEVGMLEALIGWQETAGGAPVRVATPVRTSTPVPETPSPDPPRHP